MIVRNIMCSSAVISIIVCAVSTTASVPAVGANTWLSRGLGAIKEIEEYKESVSETMPEAKKETPSRSPFEPTEAQCERFAACLAASGMSVNEFNLLGRQINKDAKLKSKVMEKANLYKMAAQIHEDPETGDFLAEKQPSPEEEEANKMLQFCETITEIERLRANQRNKLKRSLKVDTIPSSLKLEDPILAPFYSPKVRACVEAFPLQAAEIVKRHGLGEEEFNRMRKETETNRAFRGLVEDYMVRKAEKQADATKGGIL